MKFWFAFIFMVTTHFSISQSPKKEIKKPGNEPVFFLDSVIVVMSELEKIQPEKIAMISVYKDSNAIRLAGPAGKDGVVFIETKVFAKRRYWNYFKMKSPDYAKIIPTPQSDSIVQYVLNGRVLTKDFEGDLSLINDSSFIELIVLDKQSLKKEFGISDKSYGIIIKSEKPGDQNETKKE